VPGQPRPQRAREATARAVRGPRQARSSCCWRRTAAVPRRGARDGPSSGHCLLPRSCPWALPALCGPICTQHGARFASGRPRRSRRHCVILLSLARCEGAVCVPPLFAWLSSPYVPIVR
jgi:hypothetical protein